MKKKVNLIVFSIFVLLGGIFSQCFILVDVTECAVVTFLGNPVRSYVNPGLQLKWPLVEGVQKFDRRLQLLPLAPDEYLTRDKKNVMAEIFAVWQIADPIQFMQAVGSQAGAEARLAFVMASALGAALGEAPFSSLISDQVDINLSKVVGGVETEVKNAAEQSYGIRIATLQLSRLNYHEQNRLSVFERMREERRQIATRFRSEGEEEAMKIRAAAEHERARILADAESQSAKIEGEGEAEAARIYGEAISKNPDFYRFSRSLEMYEEILTSEDSIVIPADSDLLKFLLEDKE